MARPHPDKTGTKTSDDCNRQGKIRRKGCENIWLLDIRVTGLRWEQVVKRLLAGSYQWPKLQEDERAQICRYGADLHPSHCLHCPLLIGFLRIIKPEEFKGIFGGKISTHGSKFWPRRSSFIEKIFAMSNADSLG
ncbi:uncharacterized protein LOC100690595 isoform X2 [Oreochromis niloticus]|uniref:uncharacterized protein LOC100690595 isoform X2 n=1 Tax=Oreochromis niloticus TaxID=8128 RepID=UPI000DF216CB|nr:uncharacterized protein LOC100690595 isoform X2 [Oreochromis niloticus]